MSGLPPDHESYARAALPAYGRDRDATLRLLSLSENATYLVADDEPMVLRVHRPGYHSLDGIRSELSWMAALRTETPVATPELIRAADGSDVVDGVVGENMLHVDAVSFIEGCTAEENPAAVGFDELGRLCAHMHDHVGGWQTPDYFTRFRWDVEATLGPDARWGNWREAPGLTSDGAAVVERAAAQVADALTAFGQGPDRFGLIHADLRMANLMIDPVSGSGGSSPITVIDFDDCGWSWHLADLGAVVSFIEDTPEAEHMIADWLRGYREVREIPPDHLGMIPTFVMLRRLMLTAWVASHADADAAVAFTDGFAVGTAALADRYLSDRGWMRYE
ncbi:phosphotransferase enzyme family protein [Mycolicibacterium pyrenivorans]|uniref:phosphotransferase enzyme family protein n=1 Tax=Mycolicibacterium pyrenivorans TaxID=187102 RepID=UPI0021F3861E|nr:phosphotransferase [Mycolicibacterium pyrenivorans]MCV7152985.1 phosphotransferase [Mycolicibacterium pyrenivorans]